MGALNLPSVFTPNRITFCSLGVGLYGAYQLFRDGNGEVGDVAILRAGVFVFLAIVLDCCDGQLARMYGTGSLAGRILDGICDSLVAFGNGFFWSLTASKHEVLPFHVIWGVLPVTVVFFQQQAMLFDRVKNLYVLRSNPVLDTVGMEDSELVKLELEDAWQTGHMGNWLLLKWYQKLYLVLQDSTNRNKSVNELVREKKAGNIKKLSPEEYRLRWKSTMRLVSFLGTGSHAFMFYSCTVVAYFFGYKYLMLFHVVNNCILAPIWALVYYRSKDM